MVLLRRVSDVRKRFQSFQVERTKTSLSNTRNLNQTNQHKTVDLKATQPQYET